MTNWRFGNAEFDGSILSHQAGEEPRRYGVFLVGQQQYRGDAAGCFGEVLDFVRL